MPETCYAFGDDDIGDDLKMLIEEMPHIKRTDSDANLVQTFFTTEEKKLFAEACGELKMSQVLRFLALQYAKSKQRQA